MAIKKHHTTLLSCQLASNLQGNLNLAGVPFSEFDVASAEIQFEIHTHEVKHLDRKAQDENSPR